MSITCCRRTKARTSISSWGKAATSCRGTTTSPAPGDLVLFPRYLLHAVPPNQGERRITLS
ncbi:MAG: hypothetical protein E6H51_14090 [Betaproteobacteria bacterium]|nr:MAG: hypothetical protein E6H51_14090 [Betaproteobacteria bacterium]